ncbi:MAG: hypothetical protein AAF824_19805 [Bacteroidota bacterium]
MRRYTISFYLFLCISCSILVSSCGGEDLSLINQIKRLEPQWMELSEKVSFIDRNLGITQRRYVADLEVINERMRKTYGGEKVSNLRSQYRNVISERDGIKERFTQEKGAFVETVYGFNEWENKVMKNKIDEEEAYQTLATYQDSYTQINSNIDALYNDMVNNINSHNAILRSLSRELNLYTNFDIDPK